MNLAKFAPSTDAKNLSFRAKRGICFFLVLLLSAIAAASASAAPTARIECKSIPSRILPRPVNYCIVLPPSYDADQARKYPVLYFFHGLGDNDQMFVHTG